ncbi:transcriptional regulator [Halobacteria archaeon HArc-gm2]|nr:transcriptional regulator [Halobacteria archaeon HArc-gm2]
MYDDCVSSRALDRLFDALKSIDRRRLLLLLSDHHPEVDAAPSLPEIAPENGDYTRYVTGMIHKHIPKLADYGYVDWNPAERVVRRGPQFDEVAPVLELLVDNRERLPGKFQ